MNILAKIGITTGCWEYDSKFDRITDHDHLVAEVWDEAYGAMISRTPEILHHLILLTNQLDTSVMTASVISAMNVIEDATGKKWAEIKEII